MQKSYDDQMWMRLMRILMSLFITISILPRIDIHQTQAVDYWELATSPNRVRANHTATLLLDGRLLVAGGLDENGPLSSVEIYDPRSGTWTELSGSGALSSPRASASANLLLDGRVIVAGGYSGATSYLKSAEIFDPRTESWSASAEMQNRRAFHTATLLRNGKLLVVGGAYNTGSWWYLKGAELYDPVENTWTPLPDMEDYRSRHTASLLPDGRVLVAGGYYADITPHYLDGVEIYDPAANSWSSADSLSNARSEHTATSLADGSVLAVGGRNPTGYLNSVELFDSITENWGSKENMIISISRHSASMLPNGKVLISGGYYYDTTGHSICNSQLYDPLENKWTYSYLFYVCRADHSTTLMPNGEALAVGGKWSDTPTYVGLAELYGYAQGSWSSTPDTMSTPRDSHSATLLLSGDVLVAGGHYYDDGDHVTNKAERFNRSTGTWSNLAGMNYSRMDHSATLLNDGRVLVAGGKLDYAGISFPIHCEIFNPDTGLWTETGEPQQQRYAHTATLLSDGRVLLAGGWAPTLITASAEIYDPITGDFSPVDSMSVERSDHTATLLPDGRVLVAGGRVSSSTNGLQSAEIFDPQNGSWSSAGMMSTPRLKHSATLLPNGNVLVAGGWHTTGGITTLSSAEVYIPQSNSWTSKDPMSQARLDHSATLLHDGRVLAAGGLFTDGTTSYFIDSVEIFDPEREVWESSGDLNIASRDHRTTFLGNGSVLVTGGRGTTILDRSEIFSPGLGFQESWRPVIAAASDPVRLGEWIYIGGDKFRWLSAAASGGTNSSAVDCPLVQLRRVDNEQVRWLMPKKSGFTDDDFPAEELSGFPSGPAMLTVYRGGMYSRQELIQIFMAKLYLPFVQR